MSEPMVIFFTFGISGFFPHVKYTGVNLFLILFLQFLNESGHTHVILVILSIYISRTQTGLFSLLSLPLLFTLDFS
ncbi:hypothetical protein Hanom_Chr08g00756731 [Helianthus anomalus]